MLLPLLLLLLLLLLAPPDWDIINFSFDNTGTVNVIESTSKILAVGHEHHMSCTHGIHYTFINLPIYGDDDDDYDYY